MHPIETSMTSKLFAWETAIWQWRSGGIAVYEAFIVGLAGTGCLAMTLVCEVSVFKTIYALFSLRHIGLLLAVWALQVALMEGTSVDRRDFIFICLAVRA